VSTLFNNDTIAAADSGKRNFGTMSLLAGHAEDMFRTGKGAWPIERNLLTTGFCAAAAEAIAAGETAGGVLLTPHLETVHYQVGAEQPWGGLDEVDDFSAAL
jgi:hypothetical protein